LTIRQCAQGFRIAQILKELGINDEFEELDHSAPEQNLLEVIRKEIIGWDRGKKGHDLIRSPDHGLTIRRGNKDTITKNDLHHFIEDIYNNCKKYDITPSEIIGFIKDLFDSCPPLECEFPLDVNKDTDLSLSADNEDESDTILYFKREKYDNDVLQNNEMKSDK
jgi:hypothetical protein